MLDKKGFSFIEVLIIVVLIAVLSIVAVPSYRRSIETSKNNQARAKLVEVANAARMFNEDMRGCHKVAGKLGGSDIPTCGDGSFQSPEKLFTWVGNDNQAGANYAYLKDELSYNEGHTYRGYEFYICNPLLADANCGGSIDVIAIMKATDSVTDCRFKGNKVWKVSNSAPGQVLVEGSDGCGG